MSPLEKTTTAGVLEQELLRVDTPVFGRVAAEVVWRGAAAGVVELKSPTGGVMATAAVSAAGVFLLREWADYPSASVWVRTNAGQAEVLCRLYYQPSPGIGV